MFLLLSHGPYISSYGIKHICPKVQNQFFSLDTSVMNSFFHFISHSVNMARSLHILKKILNYTAKYSEQSAMSIYVPWKKPLSPQKNTYSSFGPRKMAIFAKIIFSYLTTFRSWFQKSGTRFLTSSQTMKISYFTSVWSMVRV